MHEQSEMNAKEVFGNNLRKLREKRGLLQKDFATIIGVRSNSVSNYEKGKQLPDALTLKRIADYFNTTIDDLLNEADTVATNEMESHQDIILDFNRGLTVEELAEKYNIVVDGEPLSLRAKKEILDKIELEYLRMNK